MTAGAPFAAEERDALARASLARHPDAIVAAIGPEGYRVEMPGTLPITTHAVSGARSALFLVEPADRPQLVATWEAAHATGVGRTKVRLAADPEHLAAVEIIDLREAHGIFLGILQTAGDKVAIVDASKAPARPPRVAHIRKDAVAALLDADANTTAILGWSPDELIGRSTLDLVHPDDQDEGLESWIEMLATPVVGPPTRLRHRHKDGSWIWLEVTNTNRLADPEHEDVLTELVDISAEMAAHEELRARERLLAGIAEGVPIGLCQADRMLRIVYTNERLHDILGAPRADTVAEQLAMVMPDDWAALDSALARAIGTGDDGDVEMQIQRQGRGRLRRCLARVRALPDDDGTPAGVIVCIEDVTESARMRAELELRASYDVLTRCYNRSAAMTALELALAQDDDTDTAVVFIDLDRFKRVNDRFGHAAGDELLVAVANRLDAVVRDDDIVGRIGGDEFLVVCSSVHSRDEALHVARRIAETLRCEIVLTDARVAVKASVGVACTSGGELSADDLVRRADAAMYESKHDGTGCAVLFEEPAPHSALAQPSR